LRLLHGHSVRSWLETEGQETQDHTINNAYSIGGLKGKLVLKYIPGDIEDTIYFLFNREYLVLHGRGSIAPEQAYSLTEKAIEVFQKKQLPLEEENAFKEALWDLKPNFYGMGPNLPEVWKRFKKWLTKIFSSAKPPKT